ncbi:uncharacterized protein BKA55DRAFT_550543 [Fusarium redolens]|jgi:hypothetical protein|uniref:Uncharacterized protein n=1 Tax=Fusarium redolens TaxID=48865 RepID=A0A9P9KX76_FUSRE|nr:uncharacterized protein BKA55DRAFT_550543 [Fusarium redolens]KAH7270079.1 hypothetical protein BKA55DRAFT_550543 [Fusarium redolens]
MPCSKPKKRLIYRVTLSLFWLTRYFLSVLNLAIITFNGVVLLHDSIHPSSAVKHPEVRLKDLGFIPWQNRPLMPDTS